MKALVRIAPVVSLRNPRISTIGKCPTYSSYRTSRLTDNSNWTICPEPLSSSVLD